MPVGEFLAGERPDSVAFFLSESAVDADTLAEAATARRVPDGVVVVVDGPRGRRVFERATGTDPMELAGRADREGSVDRELTGGNCPDGDGHAVRFVFAFVEEQNESAGGIYARGDVVHAYAECDCGAAYSERWVAGE